MRHLTVCLTAVFVTACASAAPPNYDGGPCVPESDQAACERLGLSCGVHDAVADNCGVTVRVTCPCNGDDGGLDVGPDAGECTAETSQATCLRLSLSCGQHDATDNCGATVRVDCACNPDGGLSTCGADERECDGQCVSKTDPNHCGGCGYVCPEGIACAEQTCDCRGGAGNCLAADMRTIICASTMTGGDAQCASCGQMGANCPQDWICRPWDTERHVCIR